MKTAAVFAALLVLSGCAVDVVKPMTATGGSKSDGIVKMSYEYGLFESAKVDKGQALAEATNRCSAWGYKGAEPFGSQTTQCSNYNSALKSCDTWMVTAQYQCTGQAKQ